MLLFLELHDKTQISKPHEPTIHHKSKNILILLSLIADLLCILQYETPCRALWLLGSYRAGVYVARWKLSIWSVPTVHFFRGPCLY